MAGKVLLWTENGYPGTVSRAVDDIIESIPSGEASNPILFGAPVSLVQSNGKATVKNVTADTLDIIGIAVRTVKTEESYGGNNPQYNAKEVVDVLKRGSVAVLVSNGSPVAGGKVYIVKATGAIRTSADSSNTVEMSGWKFKGPKDGNNVAEIVLTERTY